jgi:hypothetical protein
MIGASALALGIMAEGAEAKKVFYDINGQRYSYDTNDPDEVAAARKRIEAANAADAVRAKAAAERAANPLVSIFGSQAQRDAAQAQVRVQQLIVEQEQALAAKRQRAAQLAREARRKKEAEEKSAEAAKADEQKVVTEQAEGPPASMPETAPDTTVAAGADEQRDAPKPALKSVVFDVESGIKTTMMSDGSIHEEPFDSAILARLDSEHRNASSLTDYVNKLRKTAPEETTGSISKVARPN